MERSQHFLALEAEEGIHLVVLAAEEGNEVLCEGGRGAAASRGAAGGGHRSGGPHRSRSEDWIVERRRDRRGGKAWLRLFPRPLPSARGVAGELAVWVAENSGIVDAGDAASVQSEHVLVLLQKL